MAYRDPARAKEWRRAYRESGKSREYHKEYEQLPRVKKLRAAYQKSLAGKLSHKKYLNSPKGKEWKKRYYYSEKNQKYHYQYRLGTKGISIEKYNELFNLQNGKCAICLMPPEKHRRLCVDHNHRCCSGIKSCGKCIRGLLCDDCNHMLGNSRDSILILNNATKYLETKS